MNTNLLIALKNIAKNPITSLVSHYSSSNRMNNMGEALELYVKDIFCNSLEVEKLTQKNEIFAKYFSYIGNQNNPPDLMIKGGDAIEVKKIESLNSGIALNSSYPKNKLYSHSAIPAEDRQAIEAIKTDGFSIKDVAIQSPDNPAKLLDAKLISFRYNA